MWSMASCLTEYVLLQQGTRSDPIQLSGASYRSAWRRIPSLFAFAAAYLAPWSSLQGCLGGGPEESRGSLGVQRSGSSLKMRRRPVISVGVIST